jgi:hypothetical protein
MQEPSGSWTVAWVRERMVAGHHRALTKYLVQRTPLQAAQASEAGFTVSEILRKSFNVKNGQIAVPEDAIKVLRNVDGAHPSDVWAIVSASEANDEEHLTKRLAAFKRAALLWAKRTGEDPGPWINHIIIHEVMTR